MSLEGKIVDATLASLKGRSGFDHWWDTIDGDIQLDVITDLETDVAAILTEEGL